MNLAPIFLGAGVAVIAGLDRTAVFQGMICRPLVAAPLAGLVLGDPLVGLEIGALSELLWLSRLPVGASVPLDDTQVAIGATFLAIVLGAHTGLAGAGFTLLALLVTMPLGKIGQQLDRWARERNGRLIGQTEQAIAAGNLRAAECCHLRGLFNFAAASLCSYLAVISIGAIALTLMAGLLIDPATLAHGWLRLVLVLVGAAVLINTLNLRRSLSLFTAAFCAGLLFFSFG